MKLKYFNIKLEVYNLLYSLCIHKALDIAGPVFRTHIAYKPGYSQAHKGVLVVQQ